MAKGYVINKYLIVGWGGGGGANATKRGCDLQPYVHHARVPHDKTRPEPMSPYMNPGSLLQESKEIEATTSATTSSDDGQQASPFFRVGAG